MFASVLSVNLFMSRNIAKPVPILCFADDFNQTFVHYVVREVRLVNTDLDGVRKGLDSRLLSLTDK